jgi:hypothetical protein
MMGDTKANPFLIDNRPKSERIFLGGSLRFPRHEHRSFETGRIEAAPHKVMAMHLLLRQGC